jgi:hypothetical protein
MTRAAIAIDNRDLVSAVARARTEPSLPSGGDD